MADLQRMNQDRETISEKILNFTLEIIYLLTGEDYTIVKNERVTSRRSTCLPKRWLRTQKSLLKPSLHSLTTERNEKKILETTTKIMELLTGEVPIRRQDVTVSFSTEEWKYVEGHKDLYKEVLKEEKPPRTSLDVSSMMKHEKCPSPPPDVQDSTQQDPAIPHPNQDESMIDVKVIPDKTLFVPCDGQEDIPSEIGIDGRYRSYSTEENLTSVDGETADYAGEEPITRESHPVHLSADPSSGPSTRRVGRLVHASTVTHRNMLTSSRQCKVKVEPIEEPIVQQKSQTTEKPYSCSECGKSYSQKPLLNRHQKTHTGERGYSCSECGKSFSQGHYLMLHQRIHTGEKPFTCSECGKCFFRNDHLIRHRRVHTGEKPYTCSVCGKSFSVRFCLTEHERIHTGERPYSCLDCGRNFTSKSNLVSHQKTHSGVNMYPCPVCGESFTSRERLVVHRRVHTGEQLYQCPDCGRQFAKKKSVMSHLCSHR
ncbi:oocyte zinc finger protein XlCOF8.4-like [Hyperolius riggenbachi]|uniref:oocyte zinc finger protein XlCOF8.4-like n=1 Tax=Hyperolius riggenbachi TaxID=752182 RepID=UPI0035A3C837